MKCSCLSVLLVYATQCTANCIALAYFNRYVSTGQWYSTCPQRRSNACIRICSIIQQSSSTELHFRHRVSYSFGWIVSPSAKNSYFWWHSELGSNKLTAKNTFLMTACAVGAISSSTDGRAQRWWRGWKPLLYSVDGADWRDVEPITNSVLQQLLTYFPAVNARLLHHVFMYLQQHHSFTDPQPGQAAGRYQHVTVACWSASQVDQAKTCWTEHQKLLIVPLWNFMEWLDIIRGPVLSDRSRSSICEYLSSK